MKPAQDDLHAELRDRMRESPLLLQEAVITALETFSEHHYPQIGPYCKSLVHVGIDVSIDLILHRRTILQDCNRAALAKLLIVLNAVSGAVCIRFIYGDFPGDCTIAQWDFSRSVWTFHKPRGEQ